MLYREFKFPLHLGGKDTVTGEESLVVVYPTLRFKRPTNARGVRQAIKRLIKGHYKKTIDNSTAHKLFHLGIEYQRILELDVDGIEKMTTEQVETMVLNAQLRAEKELGYTREDAE